MGAQVISGIGFLGAGTIILTGRNQVKGITTAAGLWTVVCCGLAIGIGFYEGAIIGSLFVMLIMSVMQRVDTHIKKMASSADLYIEFSNNTAFSEFIAYARNAEIDISNIQMQKKHVYDGSLKIVFITANSKTKRSHSELIQVLGEGPGIQFMEEIF
jgi:putative Mg2+ transporter-C (MgtC) family protein